MLRPFKDKRPIGPFFTNDTGNVLDPPNNIEPPKITDHMGNKEYWEDWTDVERTMGIPSTLLPVTGLYYPDKNHVVIDDRIEIHHLVMEQESKNENTIPDVTEHTNIPFAHDYLVNGHDYHGYIIDLQEQPDEIENIQNKQGWNSFVSIPEDASMLFNDSISAKSTTDVTSKSLYHMIYALFSVGVEPESTVNMQVRGEGPIVHLDELYSNLPLIGLNMVPEQKFERDNNIVREKIQ